MIQHTTHSAQDMTKPVSRDLIGSGASLHQVVNGRCPLHGSYSAMVFNVGGQTFGGQCPRCTLIQAEAEFARDRQQRRSIVNQNSMEQRMVNSGIPARQQRASLDGFRLDLSDDRSTHLVAANNLVASWNDHRNETPWLFMFGGTGSGKTFLASAIAREVSARYRTNIKFIRSSDISRTVNDSYRDNSSIRATMGSLSRFSGLLIIDDLGWQSGSDNDRMMTAEVIASRYEEDLPLIVTTNLMPKEIHDFLGEQVFDRVREKTVFLQFEGGSVRGHFLGASHDQQPAITNYR